MKLEDWLKEKTFFKIGDKVEVCWISDDMSEYLKGIIVGMTLGCPPCEYSLRDISGKLHQIQKYTTMTEWNGK